MFVPIGTPVYAPGDGSIYDSGNSIGPATGRWVGIDLDNGFRWRSMHHSRLVRTSGRVKRGDLIAYSGASGYGHEDWSHQPGMPGAHTHVTLWPSWASRFGYDSRGRPFTIDFKDHVGGAASGGGHTPIGGFLMALSDAQQQEMYDVLCGRQQANFGRAIGVNPDREAQMHEVLVGGQQTAFAKMLAVPIADEVLGRRITAQGREGLKGRATNVAAMVAWNDEHVTATIDAVNAGGVTAAQVKVIADAVVRAVGTPTAKVDYAAIAKAVNDDVARRLAS